MTVGQNIKRIRNEKNITQQDLSQKANVSRTYIADVEGDRYNPSLKFLKSVSTALSVSIKDILNDESEEGMEEFVMLFDKYRMLTPSDRLRISKIVDLFLENQDESK